jgi:hypothetical protein
VLPKQREVSAIAKGREMEHALVISEYVQTDEPSVVVFSAGP